MGADKERVLRISDEILDAMYISEDTLPRDGGVWPEYAGTMLVCVDGKERGLISGRLHNYCFREAAEFASLDQLLFAIEDFLERIGTPERDTALRRKLCTVQYKRKGPQGETVRPRGRRMPYHTPEDFHVKGGALASFYLRIYGRRHSSMQGVIGRAAGQASLTPFRSEMELMTLICGALEEQADTGRPPLVGAAAGSPEEK